MKIVVVIPTYNERQNIGPLICALQEHFAQLAHDGQILVVDDDSPDGTGEVVRALQQSLPRLHLLTGTRAGLGAAYVRGMNHALTVLGADVVFEMDADFSHDPADLPRMIAALEAGADFVVGSRYVDGGSTASEWSLFRKLISRIGNLAARGIAGIYAIRDCTAGFRAIRAQVLERIDLSRFRTQGYAFQVELLHAAVQQGARVVEIPVRFVDRANGESKLGGRDVLEFAVNVWWIRLSRSKTFLRFCVVGASGVLVNLGLFSLMLELRLNRFVASALAVAASIIWNILLNMRWTFAGIGPGQGIVARRLRWNLVSLLTLGISFGSFVALSLGVSRTDPRLHQLLAIVPAAAANYLLDAYWTYGDGSRSTSDRASME